MDFQEQISNLTESLAETEPSTRKTKINLYGIGIGAKLLNAYYALEKMRELDGLPDNDASSTDHNISVKDQIHFFVDAFFAFLYSAYDVTAQVLNQKLQLGLDENEVSIKQVKNKISSRGSNALIKTKLEAIFKTTHFKNLDNYRNCSTHRRQIYVETQTQVYSGTPGYTCTSQNMGTIKRIICDNPLSITPKIDQSRDLIIYSQKLFGKIRDDIIKLLKEIKND